MIEIISTTEKSRLAGKLENIRERSVAMNLALMNQVSAIVEDVRRRGDVALVEYTRKFDEISVDVPSLRVGEDSLREAASNVNREVLAALREAIRRVRIFHEQEYERERSW